MLAECNERNRQVVWVVGRGRGKGRGRHWALVVRKPGGCDAHHHHPRPCIGAGVVRGDAKMGGWSIAPTADGKGSRVVYMMVTDVCGNLPAAIGAILVQ